MAKQSETRRESAPTAPTQKAPPPSRATQEKRLDKALEGTFPASDPIASPRSTGDEAQPGKDKDRRPPKIDHGLVREMADIVRKRTKGQADRR